MSDLPNYCSPHVHPQSLDTGSTPEAFAAREKELGTGVLVCTDHGSLAASRKIYDLAHKNGLTPIVGIEGYFRDDSDPILKAAGIENIKEYNRYFHFSMHFLDQEAFETGCRLLSRAPTEHHGQEDKPIFNWAAMEELGSKNITLGSGCLVGIVQRHISHNARLDLARAYYNRFRALVKPGNWFVEVFPHVCDRQWDASVVMTFANAPEAKYPIWKQFRVDGIEKGVKAKDIPKLLTQNPQVVVRAIMNNRKWEDLPEALQVRTAIAREDYVPNECTPLAPDGDAQAACNLALLDMAAQHGDPVLISDDAHYAHEDDWVVHDIRQRSQGWAGFWGKYHRQTTDEALAYFQNRLGIDEARVAEWVANSKAWASRFKDFKFVDRRQLPTKFYPEDTLAHTMSVIEDVGRMDWNNQAWVRRLGQEIKLLHENGTMDFLPYFFPVAEVVQEYERQGRLTGPGRGSAAGLLLLYLMGVTHVDPLRYKLSVDRFMTLTRIKEGKWPDVDQDLDGRDILVDPKDYRKGWLKERFGDCVAQISADTTLRLKSSMKDVCRVTRGSVPGDVEAICNQLPDCPQGINDRDWVFGYKGTEGWVQGIIETEPLLKVFTDKYPKEWVIVQKCLGIVRQKTRHASAWAIMNEPIENVIPLMNVGGVQVTQYTMEDVEKAGGVKTDFLVVNSLRDIGECIKLVQTRRGLDFRPAVQINGLRVPWMRVVPDPQTGGVHDIWDLPEDQAVFKDVCEGRTATVFQFNAAAARSWLPFFATPQPGAPERDGLDSITDLAAFTALDRPGPLNAYIASPEGGTHNMLVEYARRAYHKAAAESLPILDQLLPETMGIIVFQEQLQSVFQNVGKTTPEEADAFRVHISKKKMALVLKDREIFMRGAVEVLGEPDAAKLWAAMETFGEYGFNASHAVCYADVGYATAWLKHHYPLEWWCAVLRNADKDEVHTKFWAHCGHLVDMPDIAAGGATYEIRGDRIVSPLSLIKGIGDRAQEELAAGWPYRDIVDFVTRIWDTKEKRRHNVEKTDKKTGETKTVSTPGTSAIHRGVVYKLICAGVLDSLFPGLTETPQRLEAYEAALAQVFGTKREPVKTLYRNLNPLQRFQLRQDLLPMFPEALEPLAQPFLKLTGKLAPMGARQGVLSARGHAYPLATSAEVEALEASTSPLPPGGVNVALVAYVADTRAFAYPKTAPAKDQKHALALTLHADGRNFEPVRWPDKNDGLGPEFKGSLKGAVVVAMLSKFTETKPAGVSGILVVQPALEQIKEEDHA